MLRTLHLPLKRRSRPAGRPTVRLRLVQLEDRTVLTAYTPAQIVAAYGFNQINFTAGTTSVPGNGQGQTIAIVDAYSDPHIASDLATFSGRFGLPQMNVVGGPTFSVIDQSDGTPDPTGGDWEMETALDVEWAHAVAPRANILLVEARSDNQLPNGSLPDLMTAVNTAASMASVVSLSWGVREYPNEVVDDANFAALAHPGVTFVAASGDAGAGVGWPAISPNVVSVGGTSLYLTSSGAYSSELGWGNGRWSWIFGGSGGGISAYEAKPSYQSAVTQSATRRTNPDVAYDANPSTGVVVYDNGRYYAVGGTSAGAPQWAGLVAIADQGAALNGMAPLTGATQTLPALYGAPQSHFHDITSGNNGYPATVGYDLVTGRGTPKAQLIVNDLVQAATTPAAGGGAGPAFTGGLGGSVTFTFTKTHNVPGPTSLPPNGFGPREQVGETLSPTSPQPTGLTVLSPVTTTPAGAASTAAATPLLILPAPAAFTTTAVLPASASGTVSTAASPSAVAPTVTGLASQSIYTTTAAGDSGGSGGEGLLGPVLALPVGPLDGNEGAPAQDNNPAPMPPAPDTGGPADAGALPGLLGGAPVGDDGAAAGGVALGEEDGISVTLPNSGAAVAALLMALGYCGKGRSVRPDEEERRRDWLGR